MTTYYEWKKRRLVGSVGQGFEQGTARSVCGRSVMSGVSAGRPRSWGGSDIWGWRGHFQDGLFSHRSGTLAGMVEGWAQWASWPERLSLASPAWWPEQVVGLRT